MVFSGNLLESSLVEKKGITSAVLASPLVVVLWQILSISSCKFENLSVGPDSVCFFAHVVLELFFHHLPRRIRHLHRRNQYLTSADTRNRKDVEVRVRSFGETRCIDQQQNTNKNKETKK